MPQCTCDSSKPETYCEIHGFKREEHGGFMQLPDASRMYQVAHDPINHPPHYTSHPSGIECITITEHFSFCLGNAIKYIWRADRKNGLEDLKKAQWYIQREISRREKLP